MSETSPRFPTSAVVALTIAMLAPGSLAAARDLAYTWSPDRQVAVAQERTSEGATHCFFRDQHTGANLGEIPAPAPVAKDSAPMRASWNYGGRRVALMIQTQPERWTLCFFARDAAGHFRRLETALPDPLEWSRRRTGKTLPDPARGLYSEVGLGQWDDEDTLPLALGKVVTVPPADHASQYTFYFAKCKVRFRAEKIDVTGVRFRGPLDDGGRWNYMDEWTGDDWSNFIGSAVHYPQSESERVHIGHVRIAEEAGDDFFPWQIAADDYYADFHRFPTGDNRSIVRQLSGLNPKQKSYTYLGGTTDRNGNLVDLWNEPYVFDFRGKKARVYSRHLESNQTDWNNGRLWEGTYDPVYHLTKTDVARSVCYQLALIIRLQAQRPGRIRSPREMLRAQYDTQHPGEKLPKGTLNDPWGSRYVIRLTPTRVAVSSVHLPGEVYTETFSAPEP